MIDGARVVPSRRADARTLAPVTRIAFGSDHAGYELKQHLIEIIQSDAFAPIHVKARTG